ncbi:MAG: hypothetical protein N2319_08005 [Candidatus Kapabacteria bacterium]|nr:hypothetical protein [Candidatus Kapabacteria bacterium]
MKRLQFDLFFSAVLLITLFLGIKTDVFSQDGAKKAEEPPAYQLKFIPPQTIRHVYKMHDSTVVTRIFSDNSTKKYTREVWYYFNFVMPNPPKEGFMTFEVSIDSLKYKFTEGEAVFEFDSQADNPGALTFEDLVATIVPLGNEFNLTYSPYGEVAKIDGERYEFMKDFIRQQKSNPMSDAIMNFVWEEGISLDRLKFLADVKKIYFTPEPIEIDTLWETPIEFQLDHINFFDTLTAKITKFKDGYFHIDAVSNNIQAKNKPAKLYGIKTQLIEVADAKGNGEYHLVLHNRGFVSKAELKYNVEIGSYIKKEYFKQKIETKTTWELLKQFKF